LYKGRGRVRNVDEAREQAYEEKRRREEGRLQSEAREISRRINEINLQIKEVNKAIRNVQKMEPRSDGEAATIRKEDIRLRNIKLDLEAQKRSLTR